MKKRTIKQKLDINKTKILKANYPGSVAMELANTKHKKRVIKWLKNNNILFNINNM